MKVKEDSREMSNEISIRYLGDSSDLQLRLETLSLHIPTQFQSSRSKNKIFALHKHPETRLALRTFDVIIYLIFAQILINWKNTGNFSFSSADSTLV